MHNPRTAKRKRINLSAAMCKAARALLDINQDGLAKAIGLSTSTIRRFEAERGDLNQESKAKVVDFFKKHGLVFVYRADEVIGVIKGDVTDIIFDF